jgi:diguanylate cyclase (GGDEF)-like protein
MQLTVLKNISRTLFKKPFKDIKLPSQYMKEFFELVNADYTLSDKEKAAIFICEEDKIQDLLNKEHVEKIKNQQSEIDRLNHELYHDELTSLYNKKYFTKYIISDNNLFQKSGTLVFIDLNKFKYINDTFGHVIGDNALEVFSAFLSNNLRKSDKIIRYAGDEFIILFDSVDENEILEKMKFLTNRLREITVHTPDNNYIDLKFSFGISSFKKGQVATDIVHKADTEMYKHKALSKIVNN